MNQALQPCDIVMIGNGTFCLGLQPQRIVVTHLNELGRAPDGYWGCITCCAIHPISCRSICGSRFT